MAGRVPSECGARMDADVVLHPCLRALESEPGSTASSNLRQGDGEGEIVLVGFAQVLLYLCVGHLREIQILVRYEPLMDFRFLISAEILAHSFDLLSPLFLSLTCADAHWKHPFPMPIPYRPRPAAAKYEPGIGDDTSPVGSDTDDGVASCTPR